MIHRLPAAVKLLVALVVIATVVAMPGQYSQQLAWPAIFLGVVIVLARVSPWLIVRRLLIVEPLVLGTACLALFQPDGLQIFLLLVIKCTLCLLTAILLSVTTAFADLLKVLRAWRVPGLMITTLALMHRYLFVLVDEAMRMRRARASRTFITRRWLLWRTLASVAGQLFIRASLRAERVYAAMCARGWQ